MSNLNGNNGWPTPAEYQAYERLDLLLMQRGHEKRIRAAKNDQGPINGDTDPNRAAWLQEIIADSASHVRAIQQVLTGHSSQ